jgi:hypothetical protein
MSVRLYMDVHIPRAITDQLRRRGVDVLTTNDDGTSHFDDENLLARATELGRVLVTQDIRFCARAEGWLADGKRFAGLIFAHQLSITIGQFVRDLELIAKVSEERECDNQILRLPF